jgi:hypothetical protein
MAKEYTESLRWAGEAGRGPCAMQATRPLKMAGLACRTDKGG